MVKETKPNRLILPSLLIATLSTYPPSIVAAVLLTEISNDLNIPIGIGGQIRTTASVVAFLGSIAMTFISSRYNYKRLLTVGLLVIASSAVASKQVDEGRPEAQNSGSDDNPLPAVPVRQYATRYLEKHPPQGLHHNE